MMDGIFDEYSEKILNDEILNLYDKFYEELMNKIKDMNINLDDFYSIANNEEYIKNYGIIFSALLSAMINKISADNPDKVIELDFNRPLDYLLARVENAKVKGNIAGDYLAYGAENSQIYFGEVGNEAGSNMINSILILWVAGGYVGYNACCSKIYIRGEAGKFVGANAKNSYIVADKVGDNLGAYSVNTKVFVDKVAGGGAGHNMIRGELNANIVLGNCFGCYSKYSILRADIVKSESMGGEARGVTIYAYKIIGPSNRTISQDFFKDSKNVLYVGEETHERMKKIPEYQKYIESGQIKIWDEEDYRKWKSNLGDILRELETIDSIYHF